MRELWSQHSPIENRLGVPTQEPSAQATMTQIHSGCILWGEHEVRGSLRAQPKTWYRPQSWSLVGKAPAELPADPRAARIRYTTIGE